MPDVALADRYSPTERKSKLETWFDSLSRDHQEVILGWLRNQNIPNNRIVALIADDDPEDGFVGYRANKDNIARWRKDVVGVSR